ncbi:MULTISPECIES: TadE/TadG family type IV pilus assembly protein [Methylobacterium]|uniref:TadE/TadG family type IV pilus assembly protein n=2 Tax=Methylobacteriaceae TaxID=119045 RepID=UPI0022AA97B6|nr:MULTISPECIES: TadE/TadG family type IV pilus assembly protein [Methylobacterium]
MLRPFFRDRRGTAAIEFAMLLPVLLMMLAGMLELSRATDMWRKITLLARTVADLASQGDAQNPLTATLMSDIFAIAPQVMRPFDASGVTVAVSAMGVDITRLNLVPQVCSSTASASASARAVGPATDLIVPDGYRTQGMRYVLVEVSGSYKPILGGALVKFVNGVSDKITLSASVPWPIRGGQTYGTNTFAEIVLPGTNQKTCDGSAP